MTDFDDLHRRGHSLRNFSPGEFEAAWAAASNEADRQRVRGALHRVEAGRFHEMLEAAHKMVTRLDPDEIRMFWKRNARLMRWVQVYGLVEELTTLQRYNPFA